MLASYSSQVFDSLNDFETAKLELFEAEKILPQIGNLICEYNLYEKFGVCLLHKHFNLSANEILVEVVGKNKSDSQPVFYDNQSNLMPHTWKVHKLTDGSLTLYPLEFVDSSNNNFNSVITVSDLEFFRHIASKLSKLKMTETFGITMLHRDDISIAEDEILVESSNNIERLLTVVPVKKGEIDLLTVTKTTWKFSPGANNKSISLCIGHCIKCCKGHCPRLS